MADDRNQPERLKTTTECNRRLLRVTELESGWCAEYADRVVVDPHLDRALAGALAIPPGSTLELVRRILNEPNGA